MTATLNCCINYMAMLASITETNDYLKTSVKCGVSIPCKCL